MEIKIQRILELEEECWSSPGLMASQSSDQPRPGVSTAAGSHSSEQVTGMLQGADGLDLGQQG